MGLFCFLLAIFGLIICFGGIYIRRFCSAITGFVWGAILVMILVVWTTESIWQIDDEEHVMLMVVGAVILAIISAIYEKFCAFINGFIPTWFLLFVILLFTAVYENDIELGGAAVLSLIIALFVGSICYRTYDISYMIQTAYTGAFIAMLGFYGMSEGAYGVGDLIFEAFDDEEFLPSLIFFTLVLGTVGFFVQWRRFKSRKKLKVTEKMVSPQFWICSCRTQNPMEYMFCEKCGKGKGTQAHEEWECECGKSNPNEYEFCEVCGKAKNTTQRDDAKIKEVWDCLCGNENPEELSFCTECGRNRLQVEFEGKNMST